jgi:hypothetical protein
MKNNSVAATPLPARYSSLVNAPGVVTPDVARGGKMKKGGRSIVIPNLSSQQVVETGDSDSKRTTNRGMADGFKIDKDTLP